MKVPPMVPSAEDRLDHTPAQIVNRGAETERRLFVDTSVIRLQEEAYSDGYAAGYAAAREKERERCLRHALQTAQMHLDARDTCLTENNQQGALTQAKQAQTANDISVRIWNGSQP